MQHRCSPRLRSGRCTLLSPGRSPRRLRSGPDGGKEAGDRTDQAVLGASSEENRTSWNNRCVFTASDTPAFVYCFNLNKSVRLNLSRISAPAPRPGCSCQEELGRGFRGSRGQLCAREVRQPHQVGPGHQDAAETRHPRGRSRGTARWVCKPRRHGAVFPAPSLRSEAKPSGRLSGPEQMGLRFGGCCAGLGSTLLTRSFPRGTGRL